MTEQPIIIAIDGPAAAGKGTLARRLAAHFDFAYLDTGRLYRAVGLAAEQAGTGADDKKSAIAAAHALHPDDLDNPALSAESTGALASKVAAMPAVRALLLDFQRQFALFPPHGKKGAILDGRDIGTVVCPDALVKIFVTASPETRAKRRFLEEFGPDGQPQDYQAILNDLIARDCRDSNRATAPLKEAENAHLLDTTNSDIEAVFEKALSLILNVAKDKSYP